MKLQLTIDIDEELNEEQLKDLTDEWRRVLDGSWRLFDETDVIVEYNECTVIS